MQVLLDQHDEARRELGLLRGGADRFT
jgi:hypothetical protein